MLPNYNKILTKRILNYTRIKPRPRPPQKKNPQILRTPIFQQQNRKKVRKLCEQIRYVLTGILRFTSSISKLLEACVTGTHHHSLRRSG